MTVVTISSSHKRQRQNFLCSLRLWKECHTSGWWWEVLWTSRGGESPVPSPWDADGGGGIDPKHQRDLVVVWAIFSDSSRSNSLHMRLISGNSGCTFRNTQPKWAATLKRCLFFTGKHWLPTEDWLSCSVCLRTTAFCTFRACTTFLLLPTGSNRQ